MVCGSNAQDLGCPFKLGQQRCYWQDGLYDLTSRMATYGHMNLTEDSGSVYIDRYFSVASLFLVSYNYT